MKLEFLTGEKAVPIIGTALDEGMALVFVDNKLVNQEVIDRFNSIGHYVGERPTGMFGKLIVNLYKISVELIEVFNSEYNVPGLRFTDIDDKDSFVELALIQSTLHNWDGTFKHDFYISERLNDPLYAKPSQLYKYEIMKDNKKWGKEVLDDEQCN